MRKSFLFLVPLILFWAAVAGAQTADTHNCPEGTIWGPEFNNCKADPNYTGTRSLNASAPAIADTAGVCTGDLRKDAAASSACAQKAQAQGKSLGYDIGCESVYHPRVCAPTGECLEDWYDALCTVNGKTGHGAELLAGRDAYGGRQNVNPGWNILSMELGRSGTIPPNQLGFQPSTKVSELTPAQTQLLQQLINTLKARIEQLINQVKENQARPDRAPVSPIPALAPAETSKAFSISINPSTRNMARQAGSVTYKISVLQTVEQRETVKLAVRYLPEGVQAFFTPETVQVGGESVMTLNVTEAATPGFYLFSVYGFDSQGKIKRASATLTIGATSNLDPVGALAAAPVGATVYDNHSVISGNPPASSRTSGELKAQLYVKSAPIAVGQAELSANVGDTLYYSWFAAGSDGASSRVEETGGTCGWNNLPWAAGDTNGGTQAKVQSCQAGGTYNIYYTAKNTNTGASDTAKITVRVNGRTSSAKKVRANLFVKAQPIGVGISEITANVGDTLYYGWYAEGADSAQSFVLSETGGTCGWTKTAWSAWNTNGGVNAKVQSCQAGGTYTISYTVRDSATGESDFSVIVVHVNGAKPVSATPNKPQAINSGQQNHFENSAVPHSAASAAVQFPAARDFAPRAGSVRGTRTEIEVAPDPSGYLGVYHWGGTYGLQSGNLLTAGAELAAKAGFKIIRVTLSPTYWRDYDVSLNCFPDFSLPKLAASLDYKQLFSMPEFSTFMLTAYDGVTYGDCHTKNYLDPNFLTDANIKAVEKEYKDLAYGLMKTYAGTGKTFIISNWEGDNDIYCGNSYEYATVKSVRDYCDYNYKSLYNGVADPAAAITGLEKWLRARQEGILSGRTQAVFEGYRNVFVWHAVELVNVRSLRAGGFKSVLYDVIPNLAAVPSLSPDYISYSSYESINQPANRLEEDMKAIQAVSPSSRVVVGEFGFDREVFGGEEIAAAKLKETADIIASARIPFGIVWQLLDQPGGNFGLFDANGTGNKLSRVIEKPLIQ